FINAHRRWPTGLYALWYPVKDAASVDRLRADLAGSGIKRLLRAELTIRGASKDAAFVGAGMVICNPPWQLQETLAALVAGLQPILSTGPGGGTLIDQIAGE